MNTKLENSYEVSGRETFVLVNRNLYKALIRKYWLVSLNVKLTDRQKETNYFWPTFIFTYKMVSIPKKW